MKLSMAIQCQLFAKEAGTLRTLTKEKTSGLSIGGFFFVVNGQEVPFDWDDFNGTEENGVFSFETGIGWEKHFELSDCYNEDYNTLGIQKDAITAQFLASAERINEIHINFIDDEGDECDFGTNDADESFKIKLLSVTMYDVDTGEGFDIAQSVIDEFNNRV